MEGLQWGKPGPGGAYWRNSALTGQNFFDKMVKFINKLENYSPNLLSILLLPPSFLLALSLALGLRAMIPLELKILIPRAGVALQIPERDSLRPSTVRRMR